LNATFFITTSSSILSQGVWQFGEIQKPNNTD